MFGIVNLPSRLASFLMGLPLWLKYSLYSVGAAYISYKYIYLDFLFPNFFSRHRKNSPFHFPVVGALPLMWCHRHNLWDYHSQLINNKDDSEKQRKPSQKQKYIFFKLIGSKHFLLLADPRDVEYILKVNWKNYIAAAGGKREEEKLQKSFENQKEENYPAAFCCCRKNNDDDDDDVDDLYLGNGILHADGKDWLLQRKLFSKEINTNFRFREVMLRVFHRCSMKLCEVLSHRLKKKEKQESDGKITSLDVVNTEAVVALNKNDNDKSNNNDSDITMDLQKIFHQLTMNAFGEIALGVDFGLVQRTEEGEIATKASVSAECTKSEENPEEESKNNFSSLSSVQQFSDSFRVAQEIHNQQTHMCVNNHPLFPQQIGRWLGRRLFSFPMISKKSAAVAVMDNFITEIIDDIVKELKEEYRLEKQKEEAAELEEQRRLEAEEGEREREWEGKGKGGSEEEKKSSSAVSSLISIATPKKSTATNVKRLDAEQPNTPTDNKNSFCCAAKKSFLRKQPISSLSFQDSYEDRLDLLSRFVRLFLSPEGTALHDSCSVEKQRSAEHNTITLSPQESSSWGGAGTSTAMESRQRSEEGCNLLLNTSSTSSLLLSQQQQQMLTQETSSSSTDFLGGGGFNMVSNADCIDFTLLTPEKRVLLRDMMVNFLAASQEPVAVSLSWLFYELCLHPEIQEKVYQEILAIRATCSATFSTMAMGSSDILGEEQKQQNSFSSSDFLFSYDSNTMLQLKDKGHYLQACFSEAQRLHPSVPLKLKTVVIEDVLPICKARVSPGDCVGYHNYAMGRNEEIWGAHAAEFQPSRWLDDHGCYQKSSVCRSNCQFPVFQAGPRVCLGMDMANGQMKMVAAMLLSRFQFQLSSSPSSSPVEYPISQVLSMKHGLWVNMSRRT